MHDCTLEVRLQVIITMMVDDTALAEHQEL
jgi:hypothetical protein